MIRKQRLCHDSLFKNMEIRNVIEKLEQDTM